MTLSQLIHIVRLRLGDTGRAEVAVTDEFLTDSLNRGQIEAAERGYYIYDKDTPEIVEIPIVAEEAVYELHDAIEQILHLRRGSDGFVLRQITEMELDHYRPYWTQDVPAKPEAYIRDHRRLQLYPIPSEDDMLYLKVSRRPIFVMTVFDDEPELEPQYHNDLTWYAVGEAALLMGNTELEARALAEFEKIFGRRRSIKFNAVSKSIPNNATMYCRYPCL